NPLEGVTAPRGVRSVAVRFYTVADMRKLAKTPHGPLWLVMAYTGLRRGEASQVVKSRDVVRVGRERRLRIESEPDATGRGRTKSEKRREVPLNADALAAMAKLPDLIAPVDPDTNTDWFTVGAATAKVGGMLQRLRLTFCAHLAMAG